MKQYRWERLTNLHFELLSFPGYSSDLAASDFYLFLTFEIFLAGIKFESNEKDI